MKFLADMGISPQSVRLLRDLGFDTVHLLDEGLETMLDPDILTKARSEERILLTHDLDFSELLAMSGETLPSVVIFRLRNMRPEHVNRYLRLIVIEHQNTLERGAVLSVSEGKVRVRPLPLERD